MPTRVGGGILPNPAVQPAEGSFWSFVNGAWQLSQSLITLKNGNLSITTPLDPGFALVDSALSRTWTSFVQSSTNQHWISSQTGVADWVNVTGSTGVMSALSSVDSSSIGTGGFVCSGGGGFAKSVTIGGTAGNFLNIANATGALKINGTQVVKSQITGYGTPTGNANQGSFAASTITLPNLAAGVAQLILDLKTHGLLGT